ncbi:MAG: MFS transporter [Gammaproteobacteria bacterium]|nr:MFS transporter [Gammaproteobacteria bacterium]
MQSPSPQRWLVLFGVWSIYGTFGLIATGLAPLVKLVEHDLGMSHAEMGTVMGAWQLVYIAAALPCGILLDRLGSRWALLLGALCIAGSAYWRSCAGSFGELLAAVMLFGIGGPIISAGAPKVIATWFQGPSRGLAMGIYITGPAVGGVVSLTLTHSWLLPLFDQEWREILALSAVVAALAGGLWWLLASLPGIRPLADERHNSAHTPHGELLWSLLRQPAVRLLLAMAIGVFLISHGLSNWLPEMLVHGGMNDVVAGYWSAIPILIGIVGSLCIPRLAIPARRFRILAILCCAMLFASLMLQFQTHTVLLPGLILQGIARSTLTTVLVLTLVELPNIGARNAGVASGLFFGAGEIGGMLGPLILGVLYDLTHGFALGLGLFTLIGIGLLASVGRLRAIA